MFDLAHDALAVVLFVFEDLAHLLGNTFALVQDLRVKVQLLFVESVDGFHVFHAILKNLHFLLQLDLLLGLVVSVRRFLILQVLGVLVFLLGALLEEHFFRFLLSLKQLLNLSVVLLEQRFSLALELGLDFPQARGVVLSHFVELFLHALNELVDVLVHRLHRFDVVFVFALDGFFKLRDQLLLVRDDLLALENLLLDVLVQLFAVFLFFQFLPVPVDFDGLLVGSDDLVLDLVAALSLLGLLLLTAFVFRLVRFGFDAGDRQVGRAADLLQLACTRTHGVKKGAGGTYLWPRRSSGRRNWALWRARHPGWPACSISC